MDTGRPPTSARSCLIHGVVVSENGPSAPAPQRVHVDAVAAFGEVHVLPRRLGPADHREIRLHALAVADGRLDVPVLELGVAVAADDRDGLRPERLEPYDAVERRVDGRAVGARDVDSEVEAAAHALRRHPDARVAEEPAHGVLRVERLDRPAVGGRPGRRRGGLRCEGRNREAWRRRRCRLRSPGGDS